MSDHYGSIAIKAGASNPVPPAPKKKTPNAPVPPSKKRAQRSHKPLIFSILLFLLLCGYFLTGSYLVPWAIQRYLPQYAAEKIGINLKIKEVRLNPINFQLTLRGVSADLLRPAANDADSESLFSIQSLFIDLDLTSLIRNTFTCDRLQVDGLHLNLTRYPDKSYNIPGLSLLSQNSEQAEIMNFASLPFLFSLNNIAINKGSVRFEDRLAGKTHIIKELQLAIPTLSNFSFQSENYIKPHFSAIINGSPIQLSGEAVQLTDGQGFQTKLSCSIQSLDLAPYFSYLPQSFPLILNRGKADTTLQISFAPNKREGSRLHIGITMDARDIEMVGKESALLVNIPAIKIDAAITPLGKEFHLKDVIAKKPYFQGTSQQLSAVLQKIFLPAAGAPIGPFDLSVDRFLADQGSISLVDNREGATSEERSQSQWDDLQITMKDFNGAKATGTFHVSGEYGKSKGSFSWQGKVKEAGWIQGKLLLNEFPAAALFHELAPQPHHNIQGSATFSGDLDFHASPSGAVDYSLEGSILQFNDLRLSHKKNTWLTADSVRFTRLGKTESNYDLGNIFLKGATLRLSTDGVAPLFSKLFSKADHPLVQGIDFSGKIQIVDGSKKKASVTLSNVQFQVNRLDKTATTENFSFAGNIARSGVLKAKGILNLAPLRIKGKLAFSDVDTTALAPFFSQWPILSNSRAKLHGKGVYRYPEPSFQGDLRISQALIQDKAKTPLISWKSAEFNQVSCLFSPFSLQARSLLLKNPQIRWQRSTLSPFSQFRQGARIFFQDAKNKEALLPFEIKSVTIQNGSIRLLDKRLSPPWNTDIRNLNGTIEPLDTTGNRPTAFTLKALLENTAVTLSGSTPLSGSDFKSNARLQLQGLPLRTFSKQLASSPLLPGSSTLNLTLNISEDGDGAEGSYSSQNSIELQGLPPQAKDSETTLALALLSDNNDKLILDIPINDPSQALLNEAVTSFQTTVIKSSYAPLLLDNRFKDLQGHNLVSFPAGSTTLNGEAKKSLARYAELLQAHPRLALLLSGVADTKEDREQLLERRIVLEQQRVDTINRVALAEFQKKQRATVPPVQNDRIQEQDLVKEELNGYKPVVPRIMQIDDTILLALARKRSQIALDYLINKLNIAPERVSRKDRGSLAKISQAMGVHIDIKTVSTKKP